MNPVSEKPGTVQLGETAVLVYKVLIRAAEMEISA